MRKINLVVGAAFGAAILLSLFGVACMATLSVTNIVGALSGVIGASLTFGCLFLLAWHEMRTAIRVANETEQFAKRSQEDAVLFMQTARAMQTQANADMQHARSLIEEARTATATLEAFRKETFETLGFLRDKFAPTLSPPSTDDGIPKPAE